MLYVIVDSEDLDRVIAQLRSETGYKNDVDYVEAKIRGVLAQKMPFAVHVDYDDQGIIVRHYESAHFEKLLIK